MMTRNQQVAIALYMPVYHRGYRDFFSANKGKINTCLVFDDDILSKVDYLRKDLRALSPEEQVKVIKGLGIFNEVRKVSLAEFKELDKDTQTLFLPKEDISIELVKGFKRAKIDFYPIFLRWNRLNVDVESDDNKQNTASVKSLNKRFMQDAYLESQKSSDIWRHVGAVIAVNYKNLSKGFNSSVPSSHSAWMEGDPRNIFNRGVAIEMSTFAHAEALLIARAAKEGVSLNGADIYVTTFPCPACAKLIANSGIKRCYFSSGYAVLDGARVMEQNGVEIIKVDGINGDEDTRSLVDYKKKS